MAFGIFEADVEILESYHLDTDGFKNMMVKRLEKGGFKITNVIAV